MIRGEDVTVLRKSASGTDEMGEPIIAWVSEEVENVLWEQGSANNIGDPTRPDGTIDDVTIHLPKTYTTSVKGAEVEINGVRYAVIGDPIGYMPDLTPGAWNRPVTCRRVEG